MQDKPLDRTELDLLAIIQELHAARGPIDRNLLSVVARGRGLEVARPLARLKNLGLVEEFERKPFFLKRLFGARPVALLRPVVPDQPATSAEETPVAFPTSPLSDAPSLLPDPSVDTAPMATPQSFEAVEPAAELAAEPGVAEPGVYVPPVYEAPIYQPPVVEAPVAAPSPADEAPAPPEAFALPPESAADPVETEALRTPRAPLIDLEDGDELDMSDFALPLDGPEAETLPEPPAEDAGPVPARPVAKAPRRAMPIGYTDEIGGIAQDFDVAQQMPALSPELMDGLHEVLGGVGMELTMAGEALIGDRMAKGASAGEALSQVVLFAFAHAVRYDAASEGEVKALGLNEYAVEVMRELEKLRDAGEIGEQCFEDDMRRLWGIVEDTPEGAGYAEDLLLDPVGGAAPPALLPEDLRQGTEG
jgi:hypothetical protein